MLAVTKLYNSAVRKLVRAKRSDAPDTAGPEPDKEQPPAVVEPATNSDSNAGSSQQQTEHKVLQERMVQDVQATTAHVGQKRSRAAAAAAEVDEDDNDTAQPPRAKSAAAAAANNPALNEFERQRLERIAANEARLQELGMRQTVDALAKHLVSCCAAFGVCCAVMHCASVSDYLQTGNAAQKLLLLSG